MALEVFKLFGSIMVDNTEANKSIAKTEKNTEGLASKMAKGVATAGKWALGVATTFGTMAIAGGTALAKMGVSAAETCDNIDEMSAKLGISSKAYQEWGYILDQNGSSIDSMQGGMKTLAKSFDEAAQGSKSAIEKFSRLGLSMQDLKGLNQEELFDVVVEKLQGVGSQTERTAIASSLLGKSAMELGPVLNAGAGSIDEMKKQAHELGLVLDDETIEAGGNLADTIDRMKSMFKALATNVGTTVIPILQKASDSIIKVVASLLNAFKGGGIEGLLSKIQELIPKILTTINSKMNSFLEVGMKVISSIISGIQNNMPQIMQGIIQIINTLLQGAITMIPQLIQLGVTIIIELAKGIAQALPTLIPAILQAILTIVDTLLSNISQLVDAGIQILLALIQGILDALPILIERLPEIIEQICAVLQENLPKILEAGMQILDMLINGLIESIPKLVEMLPQVINTIVTTLTTMLPQIIQMGIDLLINLITGIVNAIPQLIAMLPEIITTIINVITQNMPQIISMGIQIVVSLIGGLIQAIPQLVMMTPQICTAIITTILNTNWLDVGWKIICGIGDGIKSGLSNLLSTVTSVFSNVWQAIKDAIKLPHLSVEGSWNPIDWIDDGLPSIGIDWYAKGGIMEQPTLFGFNGGNAMVGGEAGPEAIAPISELQTYVEESVEKKTGGLFELLEKIYDLLIRYIPDLTSKDIVLNNGALVGQLIGDIDRGLGKLKDNRGRGR